VASLAYGQVYMDLDSLLLLEKSTPDDTLKVQLYISIGQQYESNLPDTALRYYERALLLSKNLGYTRGEISYYTNATYVYNIKGRPDTSVILNQRAVEISQEFGDKERLASCLANVGTAYQYLEKYDSAMKYFLLSATLLEELGMKSKLSMLYANLTAMSNDVDDYKKALEYFNKAMIHAREKGNEMALLTALNNGSNVLVNLERYDEAIGYFMEGISLTRKVDNRYALNSLLNSLGDVYLKLLRFDDALPLFKEGLKLAESIGEHIGTITSLRGMAYCALDRRDYDVAKEYVEKSLLLARQMDSQQEMQKNFLLMADISLANGDMDSYYKYNYKNDSIIKIIDRERIQKNIDVLEQQYKAVEREQQIEALEKEKAVQKLNYRTTLFILASGIGIIFTGLVVTYLLLRTSRQKRFILEKDRELKESRINELETEKQLLASEAILKGQEDERHRLAKDLHDGLGGMLSGIKYSFSTMKDNLIMTPENQRAFERSMDMLDSSIREMRRVAHNLMPESLIKFGLAASLNDICKDITSSGALRVTFQSFDLDKLQTDQTVLITIYRIIQELLNNILKHAGASAALVQLIYQDHKLMITVEDDGRGFDTSMVDLSTGIGLSNIKSRVNYLGGILDIQSTPGKGSTFNIELKLL
jgi:signal transduction histidine kinase/TPR repeat protein